MLAMKIAAVLAVIVVLGFAGLGLHIYLSERKVIKRKK